MILRPLLIIFKTDQIRKTIIDLIIIKQLVIELKKSFLQKITDNLILNMGAYFFNNFQFVN